MKKQCLDCNLLLRSYPCTSVLKGFRNSHFLLLVLYKNTHKTVRIQIKNIDFF